MGYSQAYLTVLGKNPDDVLAILGLRRTGESEDTPDSPCVAASLRDGWFLVVANRAEYDILNSASLSCLSADCEVITCTVEEHVMCSSAAGWKAGRCVWSVTHDAQNGFSHLVTVGELPGTYAPICERLLARQHLAGGDKADVDHRFDIPVELVMSLCGYRYDSEIADLNGRSFERMEFIDQPLIRKSFLKCFFTKWLSYIR
jgi:hypothetical protein